MSKDPAFGVDDFKQVKYYNESETIVNNFLTLLFGKPGFYPSIPHLGINVPSLLYSFFDDVDIGVLKGKVSQQCDEFMDYILDESFDIVKTFYQDQPTLVFILPVVTKDDTRQFAVGITIGSNGTINYNFTWIE